MTTRQSVTRSGSVTRRSESWPVYNVGGQCLAIAATIALIIVAIALIILL
ncbi:MULTISPECIES: hypothetical protein [unclassified Gordonia (in: high G+C Gram-positive bacteria)]|nr:MULTISPECIES: hypothetical protein [unclassified Gordonia (in: high G+C Gram-positive bacteria)]UQE75168.1 hypothetical protein MYK68_00535 [Gordonia sp. PP30]